MLDHTQIENINDVIGGSNDLGHSEIEACLASAASDDDTSAVRAYLEVALIALGAASWVGEEGATEDAVKAAMRVVRVALRLEEGDA